MEKVVGPMPFDHAVMYMSKLISSSGGFIGGSKPVIGRLKSSYGYKKVIGIISFDHKIRTRIDYDPFKGFHFNFENDQTGEKICILISNMNLSQYRRYVDTLTKGRGPIGTPKMKNLTYLRLDKKAHNDDTDEENIIIDKLSSELEQDKFTLEYNEELLNMAYELELSKYEVNDINRNKKILNKRINNNLDYFINYCILNDIEIDYDELYNRYSVDNNDNKFK